MFKSLIIQQGIDAAPKKEQPEYQWRMDIVNERSVFFVNPKVWNPNSELSRYVDLTNLTGALGRILWRAAAEQFCVVLGGDISNHRIRIGRGLFQRNY